GLGARRGESEPEDDVVQPSLEIDEQQLAGDPLLAIGRFEGQAELLFKQAIHPLDLLLLPELDAVTLQLDPALPVLAGGEVALLDGALLGEAAVPLQEQLHPLPAAEPADCPSYPRHVLPSSPSHPP